MKKLGFHKNYKIPQELSLHLYLFYFYLLNLSCDVIGKKIVLYFYHFQEIKDFFFTKLFYFNFFSLVTCLIVL